LLICYEIVHRLHIAAATKKSGLALKLQIAKYKSQTNYNKQKDKKTNKKLKRKKIMPAVLGYLKTSSKDVYQEVV